MTFTCHTTLLVQIGVRQYVRCLEQSIIATLAHFDSRGYTTDDTGVWVTNCDGNPNKICAIGMFQIEYNVCTCLIHLREAKICMNKKRPVLL